MINNIPKEYVIPTNTEVIFVADFFATDITGGAELTSESIIDKCKKRWFKLHSHSLTPAMVEKNRSKLWILFNWKNADLNAIKSLVINKCKVVVVEYDYKYCIYRSSHLHKLSTQNDCNCHTSDYGNFVARFYEYANHVFFMSEAQKNEYERLFPNIKLTSTVLSSAWHEKDFETFRNIRNNRQSNNRWAILKGGSWIKNQGTTEQYARMNHLPYDLVGGLQYDEFIKTLGQYKGLIFHPAGFDTCPRLVIEAKLMGLDLDLNSNVQHRDEDWFNKTIPEIEEYLTARPSEFWTIIANIK